MPICQGSFSGIRPPFSAGCPILSGISSPHLCSMLPSCQSKPHGRARQPSCRSGSAAFCILNAAVFLRLHHAAGTICAEAAEAPCPIGQRNIKPTEQCILSIAQSNGRFKTELVPAKGHEKRARASSLPCAGIFRRAAILAACTLCGKPRKGSCSTLLIPFRFLQDSLNFRNGFALCPHLFDPGNSVDRLLSRISAREPAFFLPKREKAFFRIKFQRAVPGSREADQFPDGNRF